MDKAFKSGECDHVIEGEVKMGGQEHFYLEPQGSVIIPLENDEMVVISSTQVLNSAAPLKLNNPMQPGDTNVPMAIFKAVAQIGRMSVLQEFCW